jgi:hypothetical protein
MGFQPGIAIFADQEGQAVYEHFTSLISHIPRQLRHGIGLLCLPAEQSAPLSLLASEVKDLDDTSLLQTPAGVDSDFLSSLTTLQARLRSDAEMKRYRIYLTQQRRPLQIYIIGSPSETTRTLAAHIWREQRDQVEISALFCCPPRPSQQDLFSQAPEFVSWARTHAIRFSYFYGDLTEAMQQNERMENFAYAAALALFALLTTDISNHAQFHETNAQHRDTSRAIVRCGTLSVCLISSLHHAIRQAYAAEVGGLLLEDWQKEQSRAIATPELSDTIAEVLAHMPLAWLSPKPEELFAGNRKQRQEIVLEDFAPGPETVLIPRTPEVHTTYKQLYTRMTERTRILCRQRILGRNFLRKPSPAFPLHAWEAWQDAFRPLWQQLQDEYLRYTVLQMENIWQAFDLSGAMALATSLDEQLQMTIQKLQIARGAREQTRDQSAKLEQSNGRSAPHTERPQAAQGHKQHADSLRLNLVCVLMGTLLSFVAWLLWDELGLMQSLLLLPLVASCFGGIFVINRLYLHRTFPVFHTRTHRSVDHTSSLTWRQRCLQVSYQQRLDLALCLQQRVKCYTSAFLSQIGRDLALQAGKSLDQPFLAPTEGRNFLCGNSHHLASAFEARLAFLDQPLRGGKFIFNNMLHTRSRDTAKTERDRVSDACKDLLRTFFSREPGTCEQPLQDILYHEIRCQIDPWLRAARAENAPSSTEQQTERAVTNYISRNDFELDLSAELLTKTLQRAQTPTLWQGQGDESVPTNFFCTTQRRIEGNRAKFGQPLAEVTTTIAQERGAPCELTSRWILLCALYR